MRIVTRHLETVIAQRLTEEPVVVLNGARTVGKSTLLQSCAGAHGVSVLDLDDLMTRQAVKADPAFFVVAPEPVCIDEFQHVLPLLDAIKAQLNQDLRPGRYLVTGSTRYATLPVASQSLTGRAHIVTVWPLSQGELCGTRETFLDTLVTEPPSLVTPTASSTTRQEYEGIVLAGGFPIALARPTPESRRRWFRDFVDMVITRDVLEIRKVRQRDVLPEILRRLAAQSAQLLNPAEVASSIALDKSTVNDFIRLLEAVFLIHRLDAYGRTLSSRVNHSPKVHLVDSGLAAYLLGITETRLAARMPSTLTEFGHVIETFAVNEVLKQAGWAKTPITFSHFRTKDGHEVDLVCETEDGRVAGVEVKAAGGVDDQDFRGLRLLREKLGVDFVGGVVLYLGPHAYTKEDRLHVLPLDRLWSCSSPLRLV
ncbi:MAG: ATP-binding protein [Chloroflexota bacterium]